MALIPKNRKKSYSYGIGTSTEIIKVEFGHNTISEQ